VQAEYHRFFMAKINSLFLGIPCLLIVDNE
jgi:hypothetical protein